MRRGLRDPLGVLTSTYPLINNEWVRIDQEAVRDFARGLDLNALKTAAVARFAYDGWTLREKCNITLALNAINFSYWPDRGEPAWSVKNEEGKDLLGATAAFYCLERGHKEGEVDLLDPRDLSVLSPERLASIFRSDNGTVIPMLEERAECLRQLGTNFDSWYEETFFQRFLANREKRAVGFVLVLVGWIPNFNDAVYDQGKLIAFYKRAQLAAKMIHEVLEEQGKGFLGLEDLTAFADYRLPQFDREKGMLVYAPSLAKRVDRMEEIPAGSIEELSIRAGSVWVAEYLRQDLEELSGQEVTSAQVDSFSWKEARRLKDQMRPHHRTRTIFY